MALPCAFCAVTCGWVFSSHDCDCINTDRQSCLIADFFLISLDTVQLVDQIQGDIGTPGFAFKL